MRIEQIILNNLVTNEEYIRRVIPYLDADYFQYKSEKHLFESIARHVAKYNVPPPFDALEISADNDTSLSADEFQQTVDMISAMKTVDNKNVEWLVDQTEQFCKDRAVYNAIMTSANIINNDDREGRERGAIPDLLQKALGVSFDTDIGHHYIRDAADRYDFYHKRDIRIPFDIEMLNTVTRGGFPQKTLNVIVAGINVGKSLCMCSMAANNLMDGYNVLYITMEMAQERIAERIDANLLDVELDNIEGIPRSVYMDKIGGLTTRNIGEIIVKEFPTASANTNHFRHLLNELKLKEEFVPHIIYIDYINICASARFKPGSNTGLYSYVKAIAEEMRGLAVEFSVPIVTATQLTRSGFGSTDPDMDDTAESFGLPATADFMLGIVTSEELEALGQFQMKQMKSRYGNPNVNKRFVVGVDKAKQRLYNIDSYDETNDKPVFDYSNFNDRSEGDDAGNTTDRFAQFR